MGKVLPKGHKRCSRCKKPREGQARYCRACQAAYMREWRRGRVNVAKEEWERLIGGKQA